MDMSNKNMIYLSHFFFQKIILVETSQFKGHIELSEGDGSAECNQDLKH